MPRNIHSTGIPNGFSIALAKLQTLLYVIRENQLQLSFQMYIAIQKNQLALCEAGVGSGKTLAYLVAALVHRLVARDTRPVILSTSTIALQKAITEEYLPQLSEMLLQCEIIRQPLHFVVRKGKSHYVCDLRLQGYHSSIQKLEEDTPLLEQLNALKQASITEIDLSHYSLTRYEKDRVCVAGNCPASCPKKADCRYLNFLSYCMKKPFDFQITNHNYIFAHILQTKEGGNGLFPAYEVLVIDEAHKLPDAAQQMYGKQLAPSEFYALFESIPIKRIASKYERGIIHSWLDLLRARVAKIYRMLAEKAAFLEEETKKEVTLEHSIAKQMEKLEDELFHLTELCVSYGGKRLKECLPQIQAQCNGLIEKLSYFRDEKDLISWIERDSEDKLCSIPENLDSLLYQDLWKKLTPKIFTSGTLSVNGDFGLIKRKLGVSSTAKGRITEISVKSPFDYKQNTLLYLPENLPFPDAKDMRYIQALAREIQVLVCATHGHTLLLFTSYWVMERVYGLVQNEMSTHYPVFMMGRGRTDVLANYRKSSNGVLFASDAAGEGIDLPGDILSSLIIVKLPFAVPDPISEHDKVKYSSLQEFQNTVTLPEMLIKLKQYVGRAIRTEKDTAVISILDCRVGKTGKYRQAVLNALFDTAVTSNIFDVSLFIRGHKTDDYFC